MHKVGAHMHAFHTPPGAAAYVPLILTEKTLLTLDVIGKMHLITVISSQHLLMYSRWGIPKDSLKPHDITWSMWYLFTWPHFGQPISIQYPISQSAFII